MTEVFEELRSGGLGAGFEWSVLAKHTQFGRRGLRRQLRFKVVDTTHEKPIPDKRQRWYANSTDSVNMRGLN